jgi:hypothetical protein
MRPIAVFPRILKQDCRYFATEFRVYLAGCVAGSTLGMCDWLSIGASMANEDRGYEDSIEARNRQLQALLAACVLRDRRAFAQLYELTSAKLYGVVLRILNREDWAQDCLQETYIKVWNKAEHYRPDIGLGISPGAPVGQCRPRSPARRGVA